jgi:transposase-like protein
VIAGLRGEDSIAELCRKEGINQNLYYRWSKGFLEAGKKRLAGHPAREATGDEVKEIQAQARQLKGERLSLRVRQRSHLGFDRRAKRSSRRAPEGPTDALVKITSTNICGSDLHIYEGRANVEKGKVLGHENLGRVAEGDLPRIGGPGPGSYSRGRNRDR